MPKQILLVEDSVTMQKVIEITFAHEDYRITSAKEADEALARLRDIRPDLVLADATLSGKSGYELSAAIKADPATREIPVVLLTGNFAPYDESQGQKAGVDAHIIKPFETQVLIDKVADLLRRRGMAAASPQAAPTLMQMPVMQVPQVAPVGAVASVETRRPTIPPQVPARVPIPQPAAAPPPSSVSTKPGAAAESGAQRSTLMGIPAVNPLGAGLRPPPPPGMRVRETGNLPAINPPQAPASPTGVPMPSWARQQETSRPLAAPSGGPLVPPMTSSPLANTVHSIQPPFSQTPAVPPQPSAPAKAAPAGIPEKVPQMPRPSLIPRAPVPAPVLAVLERIAARGAEYEAIARLSMEVIEQVVWEVVPELAEVMIRAEMDRLIKDRERQS